MKSRMWLVAYAAAALVLGWFAYGPLGIVGAILVSIFWWLSAGRRPSLLLLVAGLAAFLLLVAAISMISAQARAELQLRYCKNNMQQLALGLMNFDNVFKSLPAAQVSDESGRPLVSWRALILPYLEMTASRDYKTDEPWDSPNNRPFAAHVPEIFICPGELDSPHPSPPNSTSYFAVVGDQTAWRNIVLGPDTPRSRTGKPRLLSGHSMDKVADDLASTIIVVEMSGRDDPWTRPGDLSFDEVVKLLSTPAANGHVTFAPYLTFTKTTRSPDRYVIMADASVKYLRPVKPEVARALLTIDGGEKVDLDDESIYLPAGGGASTVQVRVDRCLWCWAFLSLCIAPLFVRKSTPAPADEPAAGSPQ